MAWIDMDRDGFHDETGESRAEYDRRTARREEEARADRERTGERSDGETPPPEGGWYGDQPEALSEEEAEAYRRDRAAARRDAGPQGVGPGYNNDPRGTSDVEAGLGPQSDGDATLEGTFFLGDAGGSNARQAARRAARREYDRQAYIDQAESYLPSADDLWVQYEESEYVGPEGELQSGDAAASQEYIDAQDMALRQMQDVAAQGGLTAADRARMALSRQEIGRDVRAQREADQSALAARGMSGSGQGVASMLAGQQYGAQALSSADYEMQIAAQQRALQAMQQSGAMAAQARGASFDEDAYRRSAIDDFNRWNTEYRRGWNEDNTDRRNQTRESRRDSRQQTYENRLGLSDRRTNYSNNERDPSEVASESNERTGGLIQGIASAF